MTIRFEELEGHHVLERVLAHQICHRAVASYIKNVYIGEDVYWRCL